MKRTIPTIVIVSALLLSSAAPAGALVPVRTWFAGKTISVHSIGGTADTISGKINSTRAKCLAGRTIGADYKDINGAWRVFGFTNTTALDGSFTITGSGTHGRPAYLWLYARRVGTLSCSRAGLSGQI